MNWIVHFLFHFLFITGILLPLWQWIWNGGIKSWCFWYHHCIFIVIKVTIFLLWLLILLISIEFHKNKHISAPCNYVITYMPTKFNFVKVKVPTMLKGNRPISSQWKLHFGLDFHTESGFYSPRDKPLIVGSQEAMRSDVNSLVPGRFARNFR